MNYPVWPKVLDIQRHSNQARYSKDSEVISQELLKVPVLKTFGMGQVWKPRPYKFITAHEYPNISVGTVSVSTPI